MYTINFDKENELDKLAIKHGTDKGSHQLGELAAKKYTKPYYAYFSPLKNKDITLLEIGIKEGASIRMWRDFFINGKIYGIDINDTCKRRRTTPL